MPRTLLLINPLSRRGADEAKTATEALRAAGHELMIPDARDPGRYADIVREHKGRVDIVVIGGGDGSVKLSVGGLLDLGVPLGVLPLGTANNLARNLGLPLDLAEAIKVITGGRHQKIDVADVNGQFFLNVAGLGLSSDVNRQISKDLKKKLGPLAYVIFALKVARRMRPFRAEIFCDDGVPMKVKSFQVTVCNGRHYGPGMKIAEDATIDDGRLDLCSTEVEHWWQGFGRLPAMMRGKPQDDASLRWLHGRKFVVRTRKPMWVDADGELATMTPAVFTLHRKALTVFVPPSTLASPLAGNSQQ